MLKPHILSVMLPLVFGFAETPAIAQTSDAQKERIEELRRSPFYQMYGDVKENAPDPQDAAAYISYVARPWMHGLPLQLLEAVVERPGHFAPAIREQLMRLPDTLEEYMLDLEREEPRYSITRQERMQPYGSPAQYLLAVVSYLDREHAEPILQEFFDKVNPIVLESKRRYWEAKDAANAAGLKTSDELTSVLEVYHAASGAQGQAARVAKDFGSEILFYESYLTMLMSDDPVAQETGANYTRGYLKQILERRPDAAARIVEAAARLSASGDAKLAKAGRSLMDRLRQELPSEPRDETRPDQPPPR